jgi:tetratricopeptide (TPR) repeat protein/O-antigen ligase
VTRTTRLLDGLIEGGAIAVLALSPLPLGSVLPWAQAVIESMVAMLCALSVARMLSQRELTVRRNPVLWPGLAMAVLLGIQVIRPEGSVSPYATVQSVRLYVAYLAMLLVLSNHLVTRARIERVVWILVVCGVVYATLGLVTQASGSHRILWFPKKYYLDRLTSTFVNPNHQALYLLVPLFLAMGLLLRPRLGRRGPVRPAGDPPSSSTALALKVLLVGAAAVMGAALLLTQSRGGMFSALTGLIVVLALSLYGRTSKRVPLILGLGIALFVIYASTFGLDLVVERLAIAIREPFSDLRWTTWSGTLAVAKEAPFLGVGLGAFEDAFRAHQPLAIWSGYLVDYAHNDYLQLLAETGLAGAVILAWALVAFVVFVLGRWATRQDPFVRGLVTGGLGALAAILAHSATDFGLHMPANALQLAVLGAVLPAVVTLRMHRTGYRVDLPEWRVPLSSMTSRMVATAVLLVCVVAIGVPVPRALAARYRAADVESPASATQGELARAYDDLRVAARLDPRNPELEATLATVSEELARRAWSYGVTPDGHRVPSSTPLERLRASQDLWDTAYTAYEEGLRARPRAALFRERFGWFLGGLERVRQNLRGQSLDEPIPPRIAQILKSDASLVPLAFDQFRQATEWDPNNAQRHRNLALFVLGQRGEVPNAEQIIASGFRRALTLDRSMLGETLDRLLGRPSADLDLLWASVPPQVPVTMDLAWELDRRGRRTAATMAFEKALAIAADPEQQMEARLSYGRLLLRRNDVAGAVAQLRQALVLTPRNPDVFAALGEAYEAAQSWTDAEGAFASAVSLAQNLAPQQVNAHRGRLAGFLGRRGDLNRALVLREQIARDAPADPWHQFELGKLLEQRGEWRAAYPKYQEAERLGAQDWSLNAWVARAYARHGLLREATIAYEKAVGLAPRQADIRVELGEVYARIGRPEQAVREFRQVLLTQPNHEAARRGLTSVDAPATALPEK